MGDGTGIAWADNTFNPWWGCVEVSPACDHCYARELAARFGHGWGTEAERRFFGDKHWQEPLRWNRRAESRSARERVFCASMGDLLEERQGEQGRLMDAARRRLWGLIDATPRLDWLLLTKRSGSWQRLVPPDIRSLSRVWLGVTVESQDYLWRFAQLAKVKCAGPRWISYEPALGALDFGFKADHYAAYMRCPRCQGSMSVPAEGGGAPCPLCLDSPEGQGWFSAPEWVVIGGESGDEARAFDLAWVQSMIEQCRVAKAALFVKQFGARPVLDCPDGHQSPKHRLGLRDRSGADPSEWPEGYRVREYPRVA